MAKLFNMFVLLVAIQAVLLIYGNVDAASDNVLWTFVNNIWDWGATDFLLAFFGIAGSVGLVGIAASGIFGFKTDFLIMATAIGGFLSIGAVFAQLATFIRADLVGHFFPLCATSPATGCGPINLFIALLVGVPALYFCWTVIEWWKNKDM